MQYLDFGSFRDAAPVLTLNIGGIANCHLVNSERSQMMGIDTGPGNVMMDHAARRLLGKPRDEGGATAGHPFFALTPPRSAQRRDFGEEYAGAILHKYDFLEPELATFCAFTAKTIAGAINDFIPERETIKALVASGGGTRNRTLMDLLAAELPATMRLTASDESGLPSQFKEAIKFGVLAYARTNRLPNNVPACSGASGYALMGQLSLPPRLAAEPPSRANGAVSVGPRQG